MKNVYFSTIRKPTLSVTEFQFLEPVVTLKYLLPNNNTENSDNIKDQSSNIAIERGTYSNRFESRRKQKKVGGRVQYKMVIRFRQESGDPFTTSPLLLSIFH